VGISLDGLASGLDTTSLINALMQVEAIPQTQLKSKSAGIQSMVSALQGLNSKVAALATQAIATSKTGSLDLYAATASSDKVSVTTTPAAQSGSVDFQVKQLAQTQVAVSETVDSVVGWPYTTMTINSGGQSVTVSPLTSNLDDVVKAINAAGAGVAASKVSVGGGNYRLQLSATKSGAAGEFTISDPPSKFANAKDAQDAEVVLWAGSAAALTVKSSTNTFADILPGSSLTVTEASAQTITLRVARDDVAITKMASDLVSGANGIFSLVAGKTAVTGSGSSTTAGIFSGDSSVRAVNQSILSAASLPVGTPPTSPSEIGISITKTGSMEFDDKKFAAALAADPAGVGAKVQEIATRIAAAATRASDKYDGTLTAKITGQQSEVKDLDGRISDWDLRLASRKEALQRTYSALEVALSGMKAQQSWLTSQLAGLSSGSK
jgi:flagellar hook-associated protein 2